MRYNFRNKQGKFTKRTIRAGSLYGFRGTIVRAGGDSMVVDGERRRNVNFHKALFGYVPERELQIVDKSAVQSYLQSA